MASWYYLPITTPDSNPIPEDEASEPGEVQVENEEFGTLEESKEKGKKKMLERYLLLVPWPGSCSSGKSSTISGKGTCQSQTTPNKGDLGRIGVHQCDGGQGRNGVGLPWWSSIEV